jgi:hypothetical protein
MAVTFALAAGAATTPAQAAFCGQPFDVAPIVKLTIATYPKISHATHPIDQSYIRAIDVNGTYAYSVTEDSARTITFYWEKPTGTWSFVDANREPSTWPKPLLAFFESDRKSLNGAHPDCNNPDWKKRAPVAAQ